MITEIDLQRSKATNKLIIKLSLFDRAFNLGFDTLMISVFPLLTLSYTLQHLDTLKEDLFAEIMGNLVAFGFAFFLYDWLKKPTRLLKINGRDLADNRGLVHKILEEMNWSIEVEEADHIIAESKGCNPKQLTVIFDKNSILISSLRFGRWKSIMMFHRDNADLFTEKFQYYNNRMTTITTN